jgi:hypothetical protein
MAIYKKRYYWGFKKYNSKTGLYKGETRHSVGNGDLDWKGRKTQGSDAIKNTGMGRNE